MIYNVAILDDELDCSNQLKELLEIYKKNNKEIIFSIDEFFDSSKFIENYHSKYHILFLDMKMPKYNGMDVAKFIRKIDNQVMIVFVTSIAKYALQGYEVQAFDYILKPLNYEKFSMKLDNICNKLKHSLLEKYITFFSGINQRKINVNDIRYIEVENHDLKVHLGNETYNAKGSLNDIEKTLCTFYFTKCNACYLVNLKYISEICGQYVIIGEDKLKISYSKRKIFLDEFSNYIGGSI